MAIIEEIGSIPLSDSGIDFENIKKGVSDRLDRRVSIESLMIHLLVLSEGNIIKSTHLSFLHTVWNLTSVGKEVFKVLEKVNKELEAER